MGRAIHLLFLERYLGDEDLSRLPEPLRWRRKYIRGIARLHTNDPKRDDASLPALCRCLYVGRFGREYEMPLATSEPDKVTCRSCLRKMSEFNFNTPEAKPRAQQRREQVADGNAQVKAVDFAGIDWAGVPILGKKPDKVVAKRLKVATSTVCRARHALGIPAFSPRNGWRKGKPKVDVSTEPVRKRRPAHAIDKEALDRALEMLREGARPVVAAQTCGIDYRVLQGAAAALGIALNTSRSPQVGDKLRLTLVASKGQGRGASRLVIDLPWGTPGDIVIADLRADGVIVERVGERAMTNGESV